MRIDKKYVVALMMALIMMSCSNERMIERLCNHNRSHQLVLSLETEKDTLFYDENYNDVCRVILANLDGFPYYIREPYVNQYIRFQGLPFIFIEYEKDSCKCALFEENEILKIQLPKYMFLRHNKPYVSFFTPCFDEMRCFDCESEMSDNECQELKKYTIRARFIFENDTIYSNPINIWRFEIR